MYFSATGTTKSIIEGVSNEILKFESIEEGKTVDFTLPDSREYKQVFNREDILLIGVPVYAGRVPNVLLHYLEKIKGDMTIAVPIVLYGNRDYDDALIELNDVLEENNFKVIAAASFIGEHSFSTTLAKDRPDNLDLTIAREFGDSIYQKISNESFNNIEIRGNRPYKSNNIPKDEEDKSVDIKKVEPKTDENCIDCKICAEVCPMGSIDFEDVRTLNGICIKCGACIKKCPTGSKYFDDTDYLRLKHELEDRCKERKEPELFI